jgi:hypothetical protein
MFHCLTPSTASYAMSRQQLTILSLKLNSRTISQLWAHGSAESAKQSMDEVTVKCLKCTKDTPESEIMDVGYWWVCGDCYDGL